MKLSSSQIADRHQLAQTALREGRPRDAHRYCLEILQADRTHADAWFICGVIAGQNRQFAKAIQILENATSLAPGRADYLAELGKYLLAEGHSQQARAAAAKALALQPEDIPTLNTLGGLLSHCGDHEQALTCFRRATERVEASTGVGSRFTHGFLAELYFNFAVSLQFSAQIDAAEAAYENALKWRPDYYKAHSALATLKRQTPEHNHLARLQSLRDDARSAIDKLHLGHALAREQEDLGDYASAFASLVWGKTAYAREVNYSHEEDRRLFDTLKEAFPPAVLRQPPMSGCPTKAPIFVVGMPRTGTTLVEQILGGHGEVFAAGELQQLPQAVERISGAETTGKLSQATIRTAATCDMKALGQMYLNSTRHLADQARHFVDKLPRNFLYLGLIRLALPNAKIICLRRDPMDTCLSNYRQLFATHLRHYDYSYDLLDCGRYYIAFADLMAHWHSAMPDAVHEVRYETLVEHPETTVREMLQFCNLPWDERCLQFNQRSTSVATPSAVQVRQEINTSSVQRWRKYGSAMRPLYELLQASGCYD